MRISDKIRIFYCFLSDYCSEPEVSKQLYYVPFHFFQGNPFDGSTIKYNPEIEFCFITVKRELAKLKGYKILTKHPLSTGAEFYNEYDEGIENIDWELVDRRDYSDPECRIACMAECLALGCVKPTDFFSITVRTDEMESFVKRLSYNYHYHIDVNPYCFPVGDA
jgi:hypothetical protein